MYLLYLGVFVVLLCVFVVLLCVFVVLRCICLLLCVFVVLRCICFTVCVFFVLCVYCYSYLICRTAGQKSVSGRSCDRPPRHRFLSVSLCLQANAETVPQFQVATTCLSCSPPDLNFLVTFFFIFVYM